MQYIIITYTYLLLLITTQKTKMKLQYVSNEYKFDEMNLLVV